MGKKHIWKMAVVCCLLTFFAMPALGAGYPSADLVWLKENGATVTGPYVDPPSYIAQDTVILLKDKTTSNGRGIITLYSPDVLTGAQGATLTLILSNDYANSYQGTHGIYSDGGTVDLDRVVIGVSNVAVNAHGASDITIGDDSELYGRSTLGAAVSSNGGSVVRVGDNAVMKGATWGSGVGVVTAANYGSVNIGDNASITNDGTGWTDPWGFAIAPDNNAMHMAIVVSGGGSVVIGDDAEITAKGNSIYNVALYASYASQIQGDSYISVGDRAVIRAEGDTSYAVYADADTSNQGRGGGHITLGKSSDILTTGNSSVAVYGSGLGSSIDIGDMATIRTKGETAYGIYAEAESVVSVGADSNIATAANRSLGAMSTGSGSVINLAARTTVQTAGEQAHGVYASREGLVTIGAGSTISTTGESSDAVAAVRGGRVELSGATISATGAGSDTIWAGSTSVDAKSVITGSGVFDITGSIIADDYGSVDLTMQDGSRFTGYTAVGETEAAVNLAMTGSGALWTMTQESNVTNLALGSGATVDFASLPLGSTLRVDHLTASDTTGGVFSMKTDVVAGIGDLLSADSSAGSHKLSVQNQGSIATDGTETLTVVETGDGGAEFALANEVSIGAWLYGLRRTDANNNNWELYSTGSSTPGASGAVNTFAGSYLLAYAETQTLMQRLGDLRDTPYLSGFWFRVYGGKFESNSGSFVKGFDMDYGGVQVGYDRKVENSWKGDTYVGGYFGYGKGDLDYNTEHGNTGGNGKVDSKTVGAYATYVQDDGFYADALVKYMWMKNDFDVLDTDGDRVTGDDLSTGGLGISLELGKRFRMAQNDKGGNWYIEPQAQYSYTHQDGGHYYASNGLRIGVDEFTSSMGRLGVLVGYETAKTNFYAKASFVKEFDGDVNIVANDVDIPESFGDSWWVYGLGFTSRLNDRNNIYMSLERSDGGKFDEPWKVYAGWRISF